MTDDFIVRWATYVRENPTKWKKQHTRFINAIFEKHYAWKERMLALPNGKEKLAKLYGIKNKEILDKM